MMTKKTMLNTSLLVFSCLLFLSLSSVASAETNFFSRFKERGFKDAPRRLNQASSTLDSRGPLFQGDGQPVVAGKIVSLSGSSLILTNDNNINYIVELGSAKFAGSGKTLTLGDFVVGDSIMVQGNVDGTNVTASLVIKPELKLDRFKAGTSSPLNNPGQRVGLFGRAGGFFSRLFSF